MTNNNGAWRSFWLHTQLYMIFGLKLILDSLLIIIWFGAQAGLHLVIFFVQTQYHFVFSPIDQTIYVIFQILFGIAPLILISLYIYGDIVRTYLEVKKEIQDLKNRNGDS